MENNIDIRITSHTNMVYLYWKMWKKNLEEGEQLPMIIIMIILAISNNDINIKRCFLAQNNARLDLEETENQSEGPKRITGASHHTHWVTADTARVWLFIHIISVSIPFWSFVSIIYSIIASSSMYLRCWEGGDSP